MRSSTLCLLGSIVLILHASPVLGQNNNLTLETRASAPDGSETSLLVELTHEIVDEVGGFSFGLDHDEGVVNLVSLDYVGPILDAEFVGIEAIPGGNFATMGVVFSLGMPVELLPQGDYIVAEAKYAVPMGATTGLSPILFAEVGSPVIVIEFATPSGPIVPTTTDGGIFVEDPTNILAGTIQNQIWIPNSGGNDISVISIATASVIDTAAGPGGNQQPTAVALGAGGAAWVSFSVGNMAAQFDTNAGPPFGFVDVATGASPSGVAIDQLGDVWVASNSDNTLVKLSSSAEVLLGPGGALGGAIPVGAGPRGVAVDLANNVWVASPTADLLTKLNADGSVADVRDDFDPGDAPYGVAVDRSGFIWVTLQGSDKVQRRASDGSVAEEFDLDMNAQPEAIAIRGAEEAWVVGRGNASYYRLVPGAAAEVFAFPAGAATPTPSGISIDGDGRIWMADAANDRVVRVEAAGAPMPLEVSVGSAPEFVGDATGYVQSNILFPDMDSDLDGFDDSTEIDAGSNPYVPADTPPIADPTFVDPVEDLMCLVVGSDVSLSWSNPVAYDDIIVQSTDPAMTVVQTPVGGAATSFMETVALEGIYVYDVIAFIGGNSSTVTCTVVVGPGALVEEYFIDIGGEPTAVYGVTDRCEVGDDGARFYVTDAADHFVFALDENYVPVGIIDSPFTDDDPITGIAFREGGDDGNGSLFVARGTEGMQASIAEMTLEGELIAQTDLFDGVAMAEIPGPLGGMDLRETAGFDGILYVSGPRSCDILGTSFPLDPPLPLEPTVLADYTFNLPTESHGLNGVSIPPDSTLEPPAMGGTLLLPRFNDTVGQFEIVEYDVDPGVGLVETGTPIPLAAIEDENSFGGFDLCADRLTVVGQTTATIYELFPGGVLFIRGDADGNGTYNALADALYLLTFGFLGGPAPPCMDTADVDDDGTVNPLSDSLYILTHGFLGGPQPADPFPDCGTDPTADSIDCASHPCNQ